MPNREKNGTKEGIGKRKDLLINLHKKKKRKESKEKQGGPHSARRILRGTAIPVEKKKPGEIINERHPIARLNFSISNHIYYKPKKQLH